MWDPDSPQFTEEAAPASSDPMMSSLLAGLLEQWEDQFTDEAVTEENPAAAAAVEVAAEAVAPETAAATLPGGEADPAQEGVPAPDANPGRTPAQTISAGRSATRRESILRLLAAMYPDAAPRITGQTAADAAALTPRRSAGDGFVVFQLGGESFALPIQNVIEADRVPSLTPVPFTPEFVRGVTNRRGEVLPLIDLRLLLGVDAGPNAGEARMLVVRLKESDPPAALVVDGLGGIAWFERLLGVRLTSQIAGRFPELLRGAGVHRDSTVHVVDLERLFARKEFEELTAA
jgi:purine-binding chemotaxis protein CheW